MITNMINLEVQPILSGTTPFNYTDDFIRMVKNYDFNEVSPAFFNHLLLISLAIVFVIFTVKSFRFILDKLLLVVLMVILEPILFLAKLKAYKDRTDFVYEHVGQIDKVLFQMERDVSVLRAKNDDLTVECASLREILLLHIQKEKEFLLKPKKLSNRKRKNKRSLSQSPQKRPRRAAAQDALDKILAYGQIGMIEDDGKN